MLKLPTSRAEAQALGEYGLILALVSLATILSLVALGVALFGALNGSSGGAAGCMQDPQTC
jgi:hypothetical protein